MNVPTGSGIAVVLWMAGCGANDAPESGPAADPAVEPRGAPFMRACGTRWWATEET